MCVCVSVCAGGGDCDRSYLGRVGSVGHVASPNFPFDYADNLTCRSTIYVNDSTASATSTLTVCLTFYRFQLEASSPYCSFDYVELRTGSESRVKYCGSGVWQYGVVDAANPLSNVWSSPLCCKLYSFTLRQGHASPEIYFWMRFFTSRFFLSFLLPSFPFPPLSAAS